PGGRLAPGARRMKVAGTVRVPGDKSISHRALMLAALTRGGGGGGGGGRCELTGLLAGEDVKSTARVLRRMGAVVSTVGGGVAGAASSRGGSPVRTSRARRGCCAGWAPSCRRCATEWS